jgi:hypothetical protein
MPSLLFSFFTFLFPVFFLRCTTAIGLPSWIMTSCACGS